MRHGRGLIENTLRALVCWEMIGEDDAGRTIGEMVDEWEETYPSGRMDPEVHSIREIVIRPEWIRRALESDNLN